MANKTTWRCRQCLANGTTVDFGSHSHMKSHLAGHGYSPWRCTGCNCIGRRREAIVAHHRASGERGTAAYNDPVLNNRVDIEARKCLLPHQTPWTGSTAVPPPHAAALDAAAAAAPGPSQTAINDHDIPMPFALIVAQTANAVMPMINHLSMTQFAQHQERVKSWAMLLRTRLNHIDDAKTVFEIAFETPASRRNSRSTQ